MPHTMKRLLTYKRETCCSWVFFPPTLTKKRYNIFCQPVYLTPEQTISELLPPAHISQKIWVDAMLIQLSGDSGSSGLLLPWLHHSYSVSHLPLQAREPLNTSSRSFPVRCILFIANSWLVDQFSHLHAYRISLGHMRTYTSVCAHVSVSQNVSRNCCRKPIGSSVSKICWCSHARIMADKLVHIKSAVWTLQIILKTAKE